MSQKDELNAVRQKTKQGRILGRTESETSRQASCSFYQSSFYVFKKTDFVCSFLLKDATLSLYSFVAGTYYSFEVCNKGFWCLRNRLSLAQCSTDKISQHPSVPH